MTVIIGIALLLGSFFCIVAAIGILRLQDAYQRMHAATKAGTVGVGFILFAVALFFQDVSVTSRAIGTLLFLLLTAPVAAHALGKALYDKGYVFWKNEKKN